MSNHAIHTPELIPVLKGEKYSRACGAEARHQARAAEDGIAIDGVLFPMKEYCSHMMTMLNLVRERGKKAKKQKKAKR